MYSAVEHVCMSEYVYVPDTATLSLNILLHIHVLLLLLFFMVVHILKCLNTLLVIVKNGVNTIYCLVQIILVLWQTNPY